MFTIFNSQDDEFESESMPLSSGSSTQSIHSRQLSNAARQVRNSSIKNRNSSLSRRNNNHQRNQLHLSHHDHHLLILAGLLIAGVLIVLPLGIISQMKSESMKMNETMLSPQICTSESCSIKNTNTKTNSFDGLSTTFLMGSRQSITDNFVVVQLEEVECYGSITLLSLQVKMFWESCIDPKQLFSNKFIQTGLHPEKIWSYKAEIVTFEIHLLDIAKIQGLLINLEEFQFQYYLRNNITLQLYGNVPPEDVKHQTNKQKSILLLEERLTTQHLVRTDGEVLLFLYFNQNKERFSSLSLKLRSRSMILYQIISISILERKTYLRE